MRKHFLLLLLLLPLLLVACRPAPAPATSAVTPSPAAPLAPTVTLSPPTSTPLPLAIAVDGEGITLAEFESELLRYRAAAGVEPDESARARIIDSFVDALLLAHGAASSGFLPDDNTVEQRRLALVRDLGSEELFQAWLAENFYDDATFRLALRRNMLAAWMRDDLAASVPGTLEQVHARQVLLYNPEEAKNVLDRLAAGTEFVSIAAEYDPVTLGELGWFPRNYLLEPAVSEAAFALQPGQISPVVETRLGFHLVQVIERQADRPLDPDAYRVLQQLAVQSWLDDRRSSAAITITPP